MRQGLRATFTPQFLVASALLCLSDTSKPVNAFILRRLALRVGMINQNVKMSKLTNFFFLSSRAVVQLDTLEISHPSFSQTFYKVRNARKGIVAKLQIGGTSQLFDYLPMQIKNLGARNDLDSGLQIVMGDLGEELPKQLDRIESDNSCNIKPIIKYRVYRSDSLNAPLIGPYTFEAKNISFNRNGVSFEARAPGLNYSTTGELYKIDRFPMLRGAL